MTTVAKNQLNINSMAWLLAFWLIGAVQSLQLAGTLFMILLTLRTVLGHPCSCLDI